MADASNLSLAASRPPLAKASGLISAKPTHTGKPVMCEANKISLTN